MTVTELIGKLRLIRAHSGNIEVKIQHGSYHHDPELLIIQVADPKKHKRGILVTKDVLILND